MELVGNLVDSLWRRGSAWLSPRAAPRAVARRRVDALCDRIDANVWRQVFSFLGPAPDSQQRYDRLAFPALSLDALVERKLEHCVPEYYREGSVSRTTTWLGTINSLRCVSKVWRELARYDRLVQCLYLRSDFLTYKTQPNDFVERFRACEAITIEGIGERDHIVGPDGRLATIHVGRAGSGSLPKDLLLLYRLRSLRLLSMRLYQLPRWFGRLPLVELYIAYPSDPYRPVERAWERDPNILPKTLEVLGFSKTIVDVSLECVHQLPRLRELAIGAKRTDTVPDWFHELTSLRRFELLGGAPVDWSQQLRDMDLKSVHYSPHISDRDADDLCLALDNLFLETRCGTSLRELHLRSYDGLRRVPDALRSLINLQHLDLSNNEDVEALPDWIGELPLVVLNLSGTGLRTLPTSLRATTTLRILELVWTDWLSGPQRESRSDRAFMFAGSGEIYLDDSEASDDIARRDSILLPLSLALPDLRLRLHPWNRVHNLPPRMFWWHARCGRHWTDPEFY